MCFCLETALIHKYVSSFTDMQIFFCNTLLENVLINVDVIIIQPYKYILKSKFYCIWFFF